VNENSGILDHPIDLSTRLQPALAKFQPSPRQQLVNHPVTEETTPPTKPNQPLAAGR
jgi:hypothetical protein